MGLPFVGPALPPTDGQSLSHLGACLPADCCLHLSSGRGARTVEWPRGWGQLVQHASSPGFLFTKQERPCPGLPQPYIPARAVQELRGPWIAELLLSGMRSGSCPATHRQHTCPIQRRALHPLLNSAAAFQLWEPTWSPLSDLTC